MLQLAKIGGDSRPSSTANKVVTTKKGHRLACRNRHRMLFFFIGRVKVTRSAFGGASTLCAIMVVLSLVLPVAAEPRACNIKGNVSTRGERIYHVPGQKYYDETRISASHGERWFCSEEEARAAGWRRSRV